MTPLIGKEAPDFSATAVQGTNIIDKFKLSDLKGKYIVLFFYPLDFTFVCPTELLAFNDKLGEFKSRGVELVAASIDSQHAHYAWLSTPRSKGGIEGVRYPIVSDINKNISKDYGVLSEENGVAFRGLFLIDKEFIVRHLVINDLSLGRNVDEALRMIDALQYTEKHGEVCPANWTKGSKAMEASQAGLENYFKD